MVTKKVTVKKPAVKPAPKPVQRPILTDSEKEFARAWPDTLFTILYVLDRTGIKYRPQLTPELGIAFEEAWDGQFAQEKLWDVVSFLPARITSAHRHTISDYDMLLDSCKEYLTAQEKRRLKEERRNTVLRELSDEQLEALDLTRPR